MKKFFEIGGEFFKGDDVVWFKTSETKIGNSLEFTMKSTSAELEVMGLMGTSFEYIVTKKELDEFKGVVDGKTKRSYS